jgi:formylglycine-generating enzyme required for sulfatase activity
MTSKTSDPAAIPGLDGLLARLRSAGIAVGPEEWVRLYHTLTLEPPHTRAEWQARLSCLLAKDLPQQDVLEQVFEPWWQTVERQLADLEHKAGKVSRKTPEGQVPSGASGVPEDTETEKETGAGPPARRWGWLGAAGLAVATGLLWWWLHSTPPEVLVEPPPTVPLPQSDVEIPFQPAKQAWYWAPEIEVVSPQPFWRLVLPTLAVPMLLGLLGWRFRRLRSPPPPAEARRAGPAWRPLLPPLASETLLSPADLQLAALGVEHFLSETPTRQLDAAATVAATCREGGIPVVHYLPARFPRELWLWRDALASPPEIRHLIDELAEGLTRRGLPLRRARFWGTPLELLDTQGISLQPLTLEGHRQQAWVLVFTDGRRLDEDLRSALRRPKRVELLRALAEWPRLAFVDTADNRFALAATLEPFDIECLRPEQVTARLGGVVSAATGSQRPSLSPEQRIQLKVWAAACALGADGVTFDSAQALRRTLKVPLEPWAFQLLAGRAERSGDRLNWPENTQIAELDWLSHSQAFAPDTYLDRALAFWRKRLNQEVERRRAEDRHALRPWIDSLAHRRIQMEQAFLDLWDRPVRAAKALYALYQLPELRAEIRHRLGAYSSLDLDRDPDRPVVRLPWHWWEIPANTRWLLQDMGLIVPRGRRVLPPRIPGPLALGTGLLGGLLVVALVKLAGLVTLAPTVTHYPPPFQQAGFQAQTVQAMIPLAPGTQRLIVGTPRHLTQALAGPGQVFRVRWTDAAGQPAWTSRANPERPDGSQENDWALWYAGTLANPIRACEKDWPRRSLVVIQASATGHDTPAVRLAAELLDRGSADKVLIGRDWRRKLGDFLQINGADSGPDQLLVIGPEVPGDLGFAGELAWVETEGGALDAALRRLRTALPRWQPLRLDDPAAPARKRDPGGAHPLTELWGAVQGMRLHGGDTAWLRPSPERWTHESSGVIFVRVCPGSFQMGSEKTDANAYPNERPAYQVALSGFWVAETETSNAQWQRANPKYAKNDQTPKDTVNWHDAQRFCQALSDPDARGDLPSEAQWEYAARGGSTGPWSFGDNLDLAGDFAWFDGNSDYRSHAVASKLPNPLGLYDIHGNLWEWTTGCYRAKNSQVPSPIYRQRAQQPVTVDPLDASQCDWRVLRGGSFRGSPPFLRSARRGSFGPVGEDWDLGFRCVRVPARQPLTN